MYDVLFYVTTDSRWSYFSIEHLQEKKKKIKQNTLFEVALPTISPNCKQRTIT